MPQTRPRRRAKKHTSVFRRVYGGLVVVSALIVGVYILWPMVIKPPAQQTEKPKPPAQNSSSTSQPEQPSGPVRREQTYNILLVGVDDGHGNADTIMLLQYDVPNQTVGVVSIPRDTMVDRDWTRIPKINAAYGKGGVELLKEEISRTLGVPIDYHIQVGLQAFVEVVDQVGGLDFYVPEDMYHDDEGGFVINLKKGQQWLSGRKTLELVRYRGYGNADIGRTEMQREVLTALAKKLLSFGGIANIQSFLKIFNEHVDTDLSWTDITFLAQSAFGLDTETGVTTAVLPGRGDAVLGKTKWCYELDPDQTLEMVNAMLNPYDEPLTLADLDLIKGESYLQ